MEKRTITRFMAIFLMVMMAFGAFSQQLVPDFFNYQAIVRDSDGNIVADQSVTVRMTFMDGTTVVTTEDYMVSTNDYGLITLAADLLPAEFIGTYYADPSIKIEIDFGSGFVNLGENDLASVPYAMQAGNVATLNGNELTVGTGSTVTIPDAALVGQNAADIVTLQGQVLTIESTITLMGTTVADHTTRIEALENAGFITSETDPVFAASAAANINQVFINNWNMAYGWGNHATVGYLTSYTETDPVFGISVAATITGSDVGNWNMAYGWGDHSQAGYLTSFTESDPVFGVSVAASITGSDVTNWNMAYGWGDHSQVGYLTSFTELDPVFGVSVAAAITGSDVTNWDAAYGWGNHASVGYLTAETDPIFGVSTAAAITGSDVTNWNTAYGWGDHSLVGYLTSFTELDPVFGASIAAAITGSDVGNWNTAYGWGDHGIVGYLTAEADPYFVASTAYGITDSDVDNWDEAFGWGDHGLVGYLTAETDPFFVASTAYGITDSDVDNWDEAFGWGDHQPAITALQSELDVTQNGAGLTASGTYVADITSHYMQTATSLFNADQSLDNSIFSVNTQVNTNTSNISQNTSDIADNAAAIATNAANIAQNASDIDDNETAIAANAANIAQNASDIATNAAGIAANAAQIATNVVNIATNASGISYNFALIGANQVAIAQNASDIASNAVNIAQNASDISSTQAELDVTQVGAGLNPDGTYGTPTKAYNYIGTASSLFNADVLLDAQVKINEDNIAGNLLLIMDNADNIASNASDIVSNYNLINDNSHWIFDEDQDTYITVEETADEDKIHIYQDGTEVLRIPQKGVLEMLGKSLAIGEGSGINQVNAEGKNTFIGSYAGHNTTIGINNLFIGNSAGKANTSGSNNLYIGNEAGLLNAAGSENTFIGAASGRASQLNSGNTFIGARSGFSSDEGSNNTYIGINAGYNSDEGSSNVLIGANVGYELTTGEANTYIGNLAGYNSTTGYRNAYVGFQAGYYNSTGSHNTFLGNEAGYWETGSDKLYIANDRGGNLANGREVALIYGEFDNDILHLNAITTVTNTLQAGESPDHSIGDAAFIVDGGAYIYRNFYVNEQTFLDQTTIDVNDGEFLIHDGEGYPSASTNGIMADVNGYIGLVSSVNSGDAQTGIQTIDEDNRPTAAISLNAVVGGVDIQAGDDIAIDAQTVYINGVDAAKGSNMAVGIGTDNTDGNIHIAYDTGDRIVNIGNYVYGFKAPAYTDEVNIGAEYVNIGSTRGIAMLSESDVEVQSFENMHFISWSSVNAAEGTTDPAIPAISFEAFNGGIDLEADQDIAMDADNIFGTVTESISFDAVTTSNFTVATGDLQLITNTADVDIDGQTNVEITAVTGIVDIDGATQIDMDSPIITGDATDYISFDAVNTSNYTVSSGDLRLETSSADIYVDSNDQVFITGDNATDATVGTTQTGAIQLTAVNGGLDVSAGLDVTVDAANTIYLNGGAAAKAAGLSVGIATDNTNGDVNIAFDQGQRDVRIGQYQAAGTYTNQIILGSNTLSAHTFGNTTILADANIDMDATSIFGDATSLISLNASETSDFTVTSGDLDLITTLGTVDIDAGDNVEITAASDVDIDGTNIYGDANGGAISFDADAASNFNTSAGNLSFDAEDANVIVDGHTGVYVDATGTTAPVEINATGVINIGNDAVNQNINMGTAGNRTINIGNDGATLVDVNATDIYLDAGNNVDIDAADDVFIDAADVVSIDAVNTSNFTVSTGDLDLITTVGTVDIDAGDNVEITAASDVDIDGTNILADATDQISLDAVNTSNFTVSTGDLQLYTGIADVDIDAADQFLVDADGTQDAAAGTGTLAAIQLTSAGGIDLEAADDIAIDGTTVYINGVDAAKGTNLAIGIGTDNTSGNIQIGYDQGARNINIGQYEAAGGYTSAITIGGNTLTSHTYSNTDIETEANMILDAAVDVDMDAGHDVLIRAASDVDIAAVNINGDATGSINLDADAVSHFNTSAGNLSLDAEAANIVIDGHTGVYMDATGTTAPLEINATGIINIGNDGVAQAINIGTAGGRNITIGSDASAALVDVNATNINLDAGSNVDINGGNNVTVFATAALDLDGATTTIDGSTTIDIGTVNTGSPINIGTAGTRTITVGNNGATEVQIDADLVDINSDNAVTINAAAASNFTVDGANLLVQTTTSGEIHAVSAGTASATIGATRTGAIQLYAAAGGIDIAGTNVAIDALSGGAVYINGSSAKGTGTAVGIGTNNASGNILIGNDDGAREIKIGKDGATTEVDLAANMISVVSSSETVLVGGAKLFGTASDVELKAKEDMLVHSLGTMTMSSAEAMALNSAKGFTLYGAESSSVGSGINLSVDANTNLNLGTVEADAINVGQSGIPTNIDGTLDVDENVTLGADLDVDGATTLDQVTIDTDQGTFAVTGSGIMNVSATTNVNNILTVTNGTDGGIGVGALVVTGGVGIGENLYVVEEAYIGDDLTVLNNITTSNGYFNGVVGEDTDRDLIWGSTITGTTLTDGTAQLSSGILSNVTINTTGSITTTDANIVAAGTGIFDGVLGATTNRSAAYVNTLDANAGITSTTLSASSDLSTSGDFYIKDGAKWWRFRIDASGNLVVEYSSDSGSNWNGGASFITP